VIQTLKVRVEYVQQQLLSRSRDVLARSASEYILNNTIQSSLLILLLFLPRTKPEEFKNYISKLVWNEHQSGWSSTQKLSRSKTKLNRCTTIIIIF